MNLIHRLQSQWLARQAVGTKLKLANLLTSGVVISIAGGLLVVLQTYLSCAALLEQTRTAAAVTGENLTEAIIYNDQESGK
jgi:hypothetical protein